MDINDIYNKLPVFAQNMACCAQGMKIKHRRYGKYFEEKLREYESHNEWSYAQMCEYRDRQLHKMIRHCYNTVPYYKKMFNEYGIDPEAIKKLDDLNMLPILTKEEVKSNIADFISEGIDRRHIKIHPTGGTTGTGLKFRTSEREEAEQWAAWWRYRRLHGICFDTLCANFGGKKTVPIEQDNPPFWRYNLLGKQIFYSGYHISMDTAEEYAESLKKNMIQWLHGYPSNIAMLAAYFNKKEISVPMRWVSIGSENLLLSQRQQIEKAFCCKPIQHYGLTEGVANISERPDGRLVVDEDFACIEFIRDNESDSCKIIGSTLTNYVMPLIRYDTGDFAKTEENIGVNGRVVQSLQGRDCEYIELLNGRKIGAAALSLVLCEFEEIAATQIVQEALDYVRVNIVIPNGFVFRKKRFIDSLQKRIGGGVKIEIVPVSKIKKTGNGKQKLIISKL